MAEREIMGDAFGPGSSPKTVEPQERLDATHSIPIALGARSLIQQAVEALERQTAFAAQGTKRHARMKLAWHHLMDAYSLLTVGDLTPENFLWGQKTAQGIVTEGGDALAAPGAAQPRVEPDGGAGAP